MTVDEIIKQVRWCIDEESNNSSSISDEKDDLYMDNIIKAKIPDALHWIAITATSSSVLSSSSSSKTDTSSKDDKTDTSSSSSKTDTATSVDIEVKKFENSDNVGVIEMPADISVFNINRVRCKGWHKAVVPVEDTDDEALFMFDDTAYGTTDRPLAAVMRTKPLQVLIQPFPTDGIVTISYVGVPTGISKDDASGIESVEISDSFKASFIYYLAFLLLSAYDDTKATQMYNIALQMLGATQSK